MEISRHWRLRVQRYRLNGTACPVCNQVIFPPRQICQHCGIKSIMVAHWRRDQDTHEITPALAEVIKIQEANPLEVN